MNRKSMEADEFQREAGWHRVESGRVRSLPNNGDGDCLFRAISHQLGGAMLSPQLREAAATYMEQHLDEFSPQLMALAEEMAEAGEIPAGQLEHPDLPMLVINILRLPWTWGGAECSAALARFLRRPIRVYLENGPVIVFHPLQEEGDALRILHRFGNNNQRRTHYESILQWELAPIPVGNNGNAEEERAAGCMHDVPPVQPSDGAAFDALVEPPSEPSDGDAFDAPVELAADPSDGLGLQPAPGFRECSQPVRRSARLERFDSFLSHRRDNFSDAEDFPENENPRVLPYRRCKICTTRVGKYALIFCGHYPICGTCVRQWFLQNPNDCPLCGSEVYGWAKVYNNN